MGLQGNLTFSIEGQYPAGSVFELEVNNVTNVAIVRNRVNLRTQTFGETVYYVSCPCALCRT
jgi:hypothetical protein